MDHEKTKQMIQKHEGCVLHAYQDTEGLWTIGYGRLIDKSRGGGITEAEAQFLFDRDYNRVYDQVRDLPVFSELTDARQAVLVDMAFNLGVSGLLDFKKMFIALEARNYEEAASEMVKSKWYRQVGLRSADLVDMMRRGEF